MGSRENRPLGLESANNKLVNDLWIIISMFFSFGSMIAGVLDLADGNFDGYITIA